MKELDKEQLEAVIESFGGSAPFDEGFKNRLKDKGLIKEEFEVGKWYKYPSSKTLKCYKGNDKYYGFIFNGEWDDEWLSEMNFNEFIKATDKEVEEALIKEAKRRGFKEGFKYNCNNVHGRNDEVECGVLKCDIFESNKYGLFCTNNGWIFFEGKWAEIIEEKEASIEVIINGDTYIKKSK